MEKNWNDNELNVVEAVPKEQAKVVFNGESASKMDLKEIGQILTPTDVQKQPQVSWTTQEGQYYAVLMMDPDAPSRVNQKFGQWYHWGVLNVPGTDIASGDVIAQYVGAGPPKGTGLHRYVILVYQQSCKIDMKDVPTIGLTGNGRAKRKAKDLAAEHNLGTPIAGACFQAEFDDYVPKLMETLK